MFLKLLNNFFTHKDFLPPPNEWPGTLFSPLQIAFSLAVAVLIGFAAVKCSKKPEAFQKKVYFVLWLLMALSEPAISLYDTFAGERVFADWASILPLWPCSIFLFAAPIAIFAKGNLRYAATGYICTLGLFGGAVNFVYPATYLARYSCISMAGFRTIFYHGAMVFVAVTMILSGYHSFNGIKTKKQLLLPFVPMLLASIPAHIVNLVYPKADYLFLKLRSFFFAPIGNALHPILAALLAYSLYFVICCGPHLPFYIANKKQENPQTAEEKELVTN